MDNSNIKILRNYHEEWDGSMQWWNHLLRNDIIIIQSETENNYTLPWPTFCIKCAFNGNVSYKLKNQVYEVNDQRFLILRNGKMIEEISGADESAQTMSLHFTREGLERFNRSLRGKKKQVVDQVIDSVTDTLLDEYVMDYGTTLGSRLLSLHDLVSHGYDETRLQVNFYDILRQLLNLNYRLKRRISDISKIRDNTKVEIYKRLKLVTDYIDVNYASEITLKDLSEIAMLNQFYFVRVFKENIRFTPFQYLALKRLSEAKRLLLTTNKPISEVCQLVGYDDVSSFSKLFKKKFLQSPGSFRKIYSYTPSSSLNTVFAE